MNNLIERLKFSERLKSALSHANYSSYSPTNFAREFNLRYEGKPVTIHAARKWLLGEAIPTQEKLLALSRWLCVSAEWLRFGYDAELENTRIPFLSTNVEPHSTENLMHIADLERLDEMHRAIIREMTRVLLKLHKN